MKDLNSADIEELVTTHPLALIKATASWCTPCRLYNPVLERFEQEYAVPVGNVDIEQNTQWAQDHNILNVPMLFVFRNGKIVDKLTGALPYASLVKNLEHWL